MHIHAAQVWVGGNNQIFIQSFKKCKLCNEVPTWAVTVPVTPLDFENTSMAMMWAWESIVITTVITDL